ncbi:transcriptional regulator [Streptacidiphilus pinicola]|uniref:Transcriptional regulator n=1 Tax=Streptacidiphilus pinicola TaxID=2219663 RepID=A0A2X0IYK1_9ACTN|nr:ROK family protein [Streptacidiphilus pinicola]RAG82966.1 transcriptional regulator [Streptacidiphilus pinicola]
MAQLTGGDSSLLRRINSAVTLRALRDGAVLTLTQLVGGTGLSRPTVEGVIEGLIESGLVAEVEPAEEGVRQRGRPARHFRFRAEAGHLLGIEIGTHGARAIVSDLRGRTLGAYGRPIDETTGADERLSLVRATVAELLRTGGISRESLWAVGVGTPGVVDAEGVVKLGTALPGWTGLDLANRLRRSFRCPVLVENDANLAAIGEHWKGAAVGKGDVVFVLAGLSPGAGSLIDGRLHRGFGGAAGEIGSLHLLGQEDEPSQLLSTTESKLRDPLDEAAVARVLSLAQQGDHVAMDVRDRFVARLVRDVAALVLAMDPQIVVIGGWASGLDGVVEPLRRQLSRLCLRPPEVQLAALGDAAIAIGAVKLAFDHAEKQLFSVEQ